MDYEELARVLPSNQSAVTNQGLDNMREMMEALGNPQDKIPSLHIAGTNGKGSTAKYLATILEKAGYRVGLYTSPSLMTFNDRMQINGVNISDEQLKQHAQVINTYVNNSRKDFKWFELYTALAWLFFKSEAVDISIIETGIGGRCDATNVISSPLASIITKISYDHQELLGNTLEAIAGEKAGIIKVASPVVVYPQADNVMQVFRKRAEELGSRCIAVDEEALTYHLSQADTQDFTYKGESYTIALKETHQIYNATVAIETIALLNQSGAFRISKHALQEGLKQTKWPGRFEKMATHPDIIVDGSHNIDGLHNLATNIERYYPHHKRIAIIGVLADKHYQEALPAILSKFSAVVTITPDSERALTAQALATWMVEEKLFTKEKVYPMDKQYKNALERALTLSKQSSDDTMICIFGSFHYIGEMRELILEKSKQGISK